MIKEELKPIYDNAKSFYGKAVVIRLDEKMILKSYDTEILEREYSSNKIKFLTNNKNHFTQTTNRHINEFLQQFCNMEKMTKKELLKLANETF